MPRWSPRRNPDRIHGRESGKTLEDFRGAGGGRDTSGNHGGRPQPGRPHVDCQGDCIVFAGIPWLEYGTSSGPNIHIVDLKTSQVSDVPDSENLFSPRSSPDGRYIAALSADSTKLMLYDMEKKSWTQLAVSRFGFENWSHDGKYLYAEDYSDKTDDMVRVSGQWQSGTVVQPERSSAGVRSPGNSGSGFGAR